MTRGLKSTILFLPAFLFAMNACGDDDDGEGDDTGSESGTGDGGTSGDDGGMDDGGTADDGGSDDGGSDDGGSDDGGTDDGGTETGTTSYVPPSECSTYEEDCPDGYKCMPYEEPPVDDLQWDALGCFPLDPNPVEAGDECLAVESGVSGLDNCNIGSMCMFTDPETLEGVCVAFCTGEETAPQCDDISTTCIIANDGVLNICLPMCDPIAQDCGGDEGCYESGTGGFFCFSQDDNAGGADSGYGASCNSLNFCDPGLQCVGGDMVPNDDCSDAYCCTEWCDLSDANMCSGQAGGQECIPYFASGSEPPGLENVGLCGIP